MLQKKIKPPIVKSRGTYDWFWLSPQTLITTSALSMYYLLIDHSFQPMHFLFPLFPYHQLLHDKDFVLSLLCANASPQLSMIWLWITQHACTIVIYMVSFKKVWT